MESFLQYIEDRVASSRQELETLNQQILEMSAARERAVAELRAYEGTLEAERRRQPQAQGAAHVVTHKHDAPLALNFNLDLENVNKSLFARQFAAKHPEGFTPNQLLRAFHDAGVPTKQAYIYSLLHRNQEMGHIRQRRKKWFPALPTDAPDQVLSEKTETPAA